MSTFDYSIAYHLTSDLQEDKNGKYICNYKADIKVNKSSGDYLKVGQFSFTIILLNQIRHAGLQLIKILEQQEELINPCEQFVKLETGEFKNDLKEVIQGNICIIHQLDLLPGFRGKNIGASVIEDFCCRFKSMFSVLAVEVEPFQITTMKKKRKTGGELDEFSKAMKYEDDVFDEETAKLKLFSFFQKVGFSYLKKDWFYMSTSVTKPKAINH
ncbi:MULTISPECIES: hypothetical protein [unclassified Saccharicrinis]|uniref:hypothetical protein n=1 Tax=unclassified Saccharicrinis TaxID=2646859 RepID=UPI003D350B99